MPPKQISKSIIRITQVLATAVVVLQLSASKSFGQNAHTMSSQDEAIRELKAKGAVVTLDKHNKVVAVNHFRGRLKKDSLVLIGQLTSIRKLTLDCGVDDTIWPCIRPLTHLEELHLYDAKVTSIGLGNLKSFPKLRSLSLTGRAIANGAMKAVGECRALTSLDVGQSLVGDDGLLLLLKSQPIMKLNLGFTKVSNDGLAHIAQLSALKELDLGGTDVGNEGVSHLVHLDALEKLNLENTKIDNAALIHVGRLVNLKMLAVHNNNINESCLDHLHTLRQLSTLYLNVRVTEAGVAALTSMRSLRHLYLAGYKNDLPTDVEKTFQRRSPPIHVY